MAAETKGQEPQDVEMSESGKVPEPLGQVRRNWVSGGRAIYFHSTYGAEKLVVETRREPFVGGEATDVRWQSSIRACCQENGVHAVLRRAG